MLTVIDCCLVFILCCGHINECGLFYKPMFFSKSQRLSQGPLTSVWNNTKPVCTHFKAFFILNSNIRKKHLNFEDVENKNKNIDLLSALDTCVEDFNVSFDISAQSIILEPYSQNKLVPAKGWKSHEKYIFKLLFEESTRHFVKKGDFFGCKYWAWKHYAANFLKWSLLPQTNKYRT